VTVMVTPGTASAVAAKAVTTKIPIVFNIAIDPVQSGLFASLSRPGGNITGVSLMEAELAGKRLDLLHELLPTAAVTALLVNPSNPVTASEITNQVGASVCRVPSADYVPWPGPLAAPQLTSRSVRRYMSGTSRT